MTCFIKIKIARVDKENVAGGWWQRKANILKLSAKLRQVGAEPSLTAKSSSEMIRSEV